MGQLNDFENVSVVTPRQRILSNKALSVGELDVKCKDYKESILKTDAVLSECRKYRFALWRIWDESKPYAMIIGLNLSTADETEDDPTVKRCIEFARSWGYGGLCMANLFAFRATMPTDMFTASDPIGVENDKWLIKLAKSAGVVVAAWGNNGTYLSRSKEVIQLIPDLHCLKMNKTGEPAHPLYLKATLRPTPLSV